MGPGLTGVARLGSLLGELGSVIAGLGGGSVPPLWWGAGEGTSN